MRRNGVMVKLVLVLVGIIGLTACATMQPAPTLYERFRAVDVTGITLQGRSAIGVVGESFVANLVADDRVNPRFKGKPRGNLTPALPTQICEATGGPGSHHGKDRRHT